ncbi:hypothetical protein E2C01_032521 [Portunus trituberculatus]|uniref:Uncharacterized protein n=1 Tax=Portunus trituberculatus TaxID=210409 RepID=A0A5B7EXQ7_PORTR|nr:hypothetical protein [Portunus trituberculatus]
MKDQLVIPVASENRPDVRKKRVRIGVSVKPEEALSLPAMSTSSHHHYVPAYVTPMLANTIIPKEITPHYNLL